MGSYTVSQFSVGGVQMSNAHSGFTCTNFKPSVYVMQEPAKGQVWQPQPLAQPNGGGPVAATVKPQFSQQSQFQPMTIMKQVSASASGPIHLVQIPNNSMLNANAQARQFVAAPQQPQVAAKQQGDVVYVNMNGVLQQGVVQNGVVYLATESAAAGSNVVLANTAVPVGQSCVATLAATNGQLVKLPNCQLQRTGQQQQTPVGLRLVPVNQAHLHVPAVSQHNVTMQQHQPQPVMTVGIPANANAQLQPTMYVMQQASGPPAMQGSMPVNMLMPAQQSAVQASAVGSQHMQLAGQQLLVRRPAVAAAPPRPVMCQQQPVQIVQTVQSAPASSALNAGTQQMRPSAVLSSASHNTGTMVPSNSSACTYQASMQAYRPALAAGAKLLVPGTSVSASTASLMNRTLAADSAGAATVGPAHTVVVSAPQMQRFVGATADSNNNAASQPNVALESQHEIKSAEFMVGDGVSSSPAPPVTPGVAHGVATNGVSAPSQLVVPGFNSAHMLHHTVGVAADHAAVRGQCKHQSDGMCSPTPSVAFAGNYRATNEPGTPARSNSDGGLSCSSSSASSVNSSDPAAIASNKETVMRLVARSFVEAGIVLEQALAMVQPADRGLLAASFAAEAAAAPSAGGATEISGDAAPVYNGASGNSSSYGASSTIVDVVTKDLQNGKGFDISGRPGSSLTKDVSNTTDNNVNMGSWGFSLFSGNSTELSRSTEAVGALGSTTSLFSDVSAAPLTNTPAASSVSLSKDSAIASMLGSLNL